MTDLRKFTVEVIQTVEVTLDADKFDEAFMSEFRAQMYEFDDLEDHAKHIAQLQARGIYELEFEPANTFVEGYGPANELGIAAKVVDAEEEVVRTW